MGRNAGQYRHGDLLSLAVAEPAAFTDLLQAHAEDFDLTELPAGSVTDLTDLAALVLGDVDIVVGAEEPIVDAERERLEICLTDPALLVDMQRVSVWDVDQAELHDIFEGNFNVVHYGLADSGDPAELEYLFADIVMDHGLAGVDPYSLLPAVREANRPAAAPLRRTSAR